MARSRNKQGNRKNRRKLRLGGKVLKDASGRPITIGIMHPMPEHWALVEKHAKEAAFWERVKAERAAKKELEEELARERLTGTGSEAQAEAI